MSHRMFPILQLKWPGADSGGAYAESGSDHLISNDGLLLLLLLSSFVFIITICIEYLARCTLFAAAITGIRNEYENSEKKINK